MSDRVYSVENLNQYIKSVFDAEDLLHNIRVRGEISGFRINGGHAYFDLKDASGQISCVCFNYEFEPVTDGTVIIAAGSARYYAARGRLEFCATSLTPDGVGDSYRRLLLLKDRLRKEGLFDRKIQKPSAIRRIGVVASRTGAVIHDIINVSSRRDPSVDVVLYPTKVQGLGSAQEIVRAIEFFDAYERVDTIIVARGGGAAEDFSSFNDEIVARAVADCGKFIVSAVGHETDFTLCDFCADMRAPTPSAAAELLVHDAREKRLTVLKTLHLLLGEIEEKSRLASRTLQDAVYELRIRANDIVACGIAATVKTVFRLNHAQTDLLDRRTQTARTLLQRLNLMNPAKLLQKGFLCAYTRKRLFSVDDVCAGDRMRTVFQDGEIISIVEKVCKKEGSV